MNDFELQHLPEAYRPLSPWTYFGLGILYSLPLVGWIFLIVHAVGSQLPDALPHDAVIAERAAYRAQMPLVQNPRQLALHCGG